VPEGNGCAEGIPISENAGRGMISRRMLVAALGLAAVGTHREARADSAPNAPVGVIQSFYDVLLSTMKDGQSLGYAGRRDKLTPVIRQTFDFPLMTRLTVGPPWPGLTPEQQQQILNGFSAFSIATYANRFDGYSGERFEVDQTPTHLANGDAIVKSKLIPREGDDVELDYLMRNTGQGWHAIDVYLSGTVSELAVRRSEFSSVLRRDGPAALVNLLQRKVVELSS
jgi:phospholipid transport system substrate-binding protein